MIPKDVEIIIVAGGSGERFGKFRSGKLFVPLGNIPLIFHPILFFQKFSDNPINLVISSENRELLLSSKFIDKVDISRIRFIQNGNSRTQSVFNGLTSLSTTPPKFVLIHDCARPLLDKLVIKKMIDKSSSHATIGIVPLLRMVDTICQVEENKITGYVDRNTLRRVQTPQLFNFPILYEEMKKKVALNQTFTDESSLLMEAGYTINFVEGSEVMKKLTYREDLTIINSYLTTKGETT